MAADTVKEMIMKIRTAALALPLAVVSACTRPPEPPAPAPFECVSTKLTIGTNTVDTVVRYNKFNGEAQLLNAASFASKATGAQGNIIGWVPLGDLKNAVEELVQREQAAQQQSQTQNTTESATTSAPAAPAATPDAKKK
jgi:hypothetical protein